MIISDRSWTEINLDHFKKNLIELKKKLPEKVEILQVVKADAYGHGSFEIAKHAIENGASLLGIANVEEGSYLRYQGLTKVPILILSPSLKNEIPQIVKNNLIPSVSDGSFTKSLSDYLSHNGISNYPIHLNIDTGMGRAGVHFKEAEDFIHSIDKIENLTIEGIFSHYASSENDINYSLNQTKIFNSILDKLTIQPKYIHSSNSAAVVNINNTRTNLVRIGILSYGIYTDSSLRNKIDLSAVMMFKSRISLIRNVNKGESVGYNRTFVADKNIKYAIIPVGYADGYDYLLSNKGLVSINNHLCPVIGKVSMDMIAVELPENINFNIGDIVTLIGDSPSQIKAEYLTEKYNGNSYELLCQIGRRAKRYYLKDGKTIATSPLSRRDFIPKDFQNNKLNTIIENAISQRIESKEIAGMIYSELLNQFFIDKDNNVHYRSNFNHNIRFMESNKQQLKDHFFVKTELSYSKKLESNYFYICCANNADILANYLNRNDVEYRWLLDENFRLKKYMFNVSEVKVNDIIMEKEVNIIEDCIEIKCKSDKIDELINQEVVYTINTETYYPRSSNQLSVFLTEITKGVNVSFSFPDIISKIEVIPILSGKNKFPQTIKTKNRISITTDKDEWIFPNSGIVFTYNDV